MEENIQISGGHITALEERLLGGHDLVETDVRVELGFDVGEDGDGAVSTATTVGVILSVDA